MATARSWYSQLLKSQETAREQNRREQRRLQLELDQKHGIEFAARYRVKELDREQRLVSKELDRIRKGVHKPLAHEYVVSSPADKRSPIIVVDHKSQVRYSHEETSLYKSMVFLQNNPSALIPLISAHSQTPGYFETLERLTPGLAPDPKTIFTPNYKAARDSLDERDQRGTKYSKLSYRKSPVLRKNSPLSMHRNSPLVNKSPTEEDIKDHDGSLKHAHRSSPVDLKHAHRSSPADLKHAHRSSPVDLKHVHRSSPVDLKHAHRSSPVDLKNAHRSSPVDLKHAHRSSPVDLKHAHRSSPVGGSREEGTIDDEVTQVHSEDTKHPDNNINFHEDKTDAIDNKQAPETDSITYKLIKTKPLRNDEDLKLDLDLVDAGKESPMPEIYQQSPQQFRSGEVVSGWSSEHKKVASELIQTPGRPRQKLDLLTLADDGVQTARESVAQRLTSNTMTTYNKPERKISVTETATKAAIFPNYDPEVYNADGSIRTVHNLPDFDQSYEQAKKARYIRSKDNKERETELTVKQIFAKNKK